MTADSDILNKLDDIKAELDFIKERMVDADIILTDDDIESLKDAENDFKQGRTVRLA